MTEADDKVLHRDDLAAELEAILQEVRERIEGRTTLVRLRGAATKLEILLERESW
jgi:hypothetical protein